MQDLRCKLTPEDKTEILNRYNNGDTRKNLAAAYNVSYHTIYFTTNLEALEKKRKRRIGSWKKYYTTEKASQWKRDFRARRGLV